MAPRNFLYEAEFAGMNISFFEFHVTQRNYDQNCEELLLQAGRSVPTIKGILSLFARASALIGGNYLRYQNIARMFTEQLNAERAYFIFFANTSLLNRTFYSIAVVG